MWVKICANTNLEDARLAASLGADALGFIFAPSKRRVTPEQVAAITPHLPRNLLTVGVFTSGDLDDILRTVEAARLGGVQLHHDYDPALITALLAAAGRDLALLQVISIQTGENADPGRLLEQLQSAFSDSRIAAVLLDAAHAGSSGGLGRVFNWKAAAPALARARDHASARHREARTRMPRLLLAGGLHPDNVADAIQQLRPDGVDVASGVEAEPGRKDPERLAGFIWAAKGVP